MIIRCGFDFIEVYLAFPLKDLLAHFCRDKFIIFRYSVPLLVTTETNFLSPFKKVI
jgi:hypothetical protein